MKRRLAAVVIGLILIWGAGERAQDIQPGQHKHKDQGSPMALDKAAAAMTVPDGFKVTLFAGEPDVHQPIGFCIDHRGRFGWRRMILIRTGQEMGKTRLSSLKTPMAMGRFDKRTVFAEGFHYVTGCRLGWGAFR